MPQTLRLRADHAADIRHAAGILRGGGLVAFPTETVYGLGANVLSPEAVAGIFAAKQRPGWDPLIVHIAGFDKLAEIAFVNPDLQVRVQRLAASFWPGPLSLLLPRTAAVPDSVTAGRPLVGVRVPSHPAAQALLRSCGLPIAAPSANRFGHISPTTAEHVLHDLDGRIDAVLDGGPTQVGVESSVLDPAPTPMLLYRAGAVTAEMLGAATDIPVEIFSPVRNALSGTPESLPSPGVGIRHYAPEVQVLLSRPTVEDLERQIAVAGKRFGGRIGVLLPTDWQLRRSGALEIQPWGAWDDAKTLAAGLFAGLRSLESLGVSAIVCPLPVPGGLGDALRDRLMKAARPQ